MHEVAKHRRHCGLGPVPSVGRGGEPRLARRRLARPPRRPSAARPCPPPVRPHRPRSAVRSAGCSAPCCGWSGEAGTSTRSASCSGSGSTRQARWGFSPFRRPRPRTGSPSRRCWCSPPCSRPACRCSTPDAVVMTRLYGWGSARRSARSTTTSPSPSCRSRSRWW